MKFDLFCEDSTLFQGMCYLIDFIETAPLLVPFAHTPDTTQRPMDSSCVGSAHCVLAKRWPAYIIIVIVVVIIIIELTHSKTILEITIEIQPQPAALDSKNFSQYSSRSK